MEPVLGVEEGGLQSAEALLLGRYYMYTQVYFHPIRRIYDIHLKDFLAAWLGNGRFPTDVESHLRITDNNVNVAILEAAIDPAAKGHDAARRIAKHDHFKMLYQRHSDDVQINPEAGKAIFEAAQAKLGAENVRRDYYPQKREPTHFPVLLKDGRIEPANKMSEVMQHLPAVAVDFVFVRPDLWKKAFDWLTANRQGIIQAPQAN